MSATHRRIAFLIGVSFAALPLTACGWSGPVYAGVPESKAIDEAHTYIEKWTGLAMMLGGTASEQARAEDVLSKHPRMTRWRCGGHPVWKVKWPGFSAVVVGKGTDTTFASYCGTGFEP